MMLRRRPSYEREDQEAEDAEFDELMRELDVEETEAARVQHQPAAPDTMYRRDEGPGTMRMSQQR
jgi:hypothetical protein